MCCRKRFGQELEAISDGGVEEVAANNRETDIEDREDSVHAAQCNGIAFDAVECRAESDFLLLRRSIMVRKLQQIGKLLMQIAKFLIPLSCMSCTICLCSVICS